VFYLFFFVAGGTKLLEAAWAAGTDADRFVRLVTDLGATLERVETLLAKGELWRAVHAAAERANATITLGAFFDYCKRETQPPHVAVAEPQERSPEKPSGAETDLSSPEAVWAWLKKTFQVTQPDRGPHILSKSSMSYPLKGREDAVEVASGALINLYAEQLPGNATSDRTDRKIPVCSALSGMGKTRMAEEVCAAFAELDGSERAILWAGLRAAINSPRIGIIVTYGNSIGKVRSIEELFSIQSSFAWRLMYFFFLRSYPGLSLEVFFKKRMPSNSQTLTLRCALETVLLVCRDCKMVADDQTLCLFIGVDEYQKIAMEINAKYAMGLLEAFGDIHAKPVPGLAVLPMLTGTDFGVVGNVGSSSNANIERIPMRLLAVEDCEESIEAVMPALLEHEPARRHLFELSGVARWCIEYATKCAKRVSEHPLNSEDLERAKQSVCSAYVNDFGQLSRTGDDGSQPGVSGLALIEVVAWAFSGQPVDLRAKVQGFSWTRLRDGGLCLIDDSGRVAVPYVLVTRVAKMDSDERNDKLAIRYFIQALEGLQDEVDVQFYRHEPWHLWELFGAFYHAARINALQVIGKSVMKFSEICGGALVNGCVERVKLRPVRVFRAAETCKYGKDLGDEIAKAGHGHEKCHWISGDNGIGSVVVNGTNGQGVDIFFCFPTEIVGNYVVCVDQRKRVAKALGTKVAADLIEYARALTPVVLKDATVIAGLCSMFPNYLNDEATLPDNSFVVSRNCSNSYHGGLAGHPASRPFVAVNTDARAWIQMFLSAKAPEVAKAICEQRARKPFQSFEELEAFVLEIRGSFQPDARHFLFF
jgi:hypothetical protein